MAASKHRVKLLNLKITPLADILSAARTCYSAKGIVLPEDFCDGLQEKEMELIESIYKAGHLTTFQHTHLHFGIENISRNCIWSFLHSHPFHNSEQVSQRYCQVKKTELFMPDGLDESGENIIGECYEYTMNAYKKLREKLLPACAAEYLKRFPGKKADDKVTVKAAEKRAQELARYVLPLGTSSRLHHTISLLTLLRYAQSATTCELPMEQTALVKLMLAEVLKHEPQLERFIPESILRHSNAEELFYKSLNVKPAPESFIREFDQSLNGLVSRLIMFSPEQESAVAETLNTVFGLPENHSTPEKILSAFLQSCQNQLFSQNLNPALHSSLGQCLSFVRYTFRKKLSHTADSQNQRHRGSVGYRPLLQAHFCGQPDYIMPAIISDDENLSGSYRETMHRNFNFIEKAIKNDMPFEQLSYMLPNSFPVRFIENVDLAALRHKMSMRLCVNAQDEIRRAAIEETEQIKLVHPTIAEILQAPCQARKSGQVKPYCPEGERFCGLPVWRKPELIRFGCDF